MLSAPKLTVDDSSKQPPEGRADFSFEAPSHGFALPVYASQPASPLTTQHSVPAGSLRLAGQVHLLLGHFTRFLLLHASPLSVFVWRNNLLKSSTERWLEGQGGERRERGL